MKKLLATLASLLLFTSLAFAQNLPLRTTANGLDLIVNGHVAGGLVPVANTCPGFVLSGAGNDNAGTIGMTSASTCSITFGRAYIAPPTCMANAINAVTPAAGSVATTTTGFTVTFAAAQTQFVYFCSGG